MLSIKRCIGLNQIRNLITFACRVLDNDLRFFETSTNLFIIVCEFFYGEVAHTYNLLLFMKHKIILILLICVSQLFENDAKGQVSAENFFLGLQEANGANSQSDTAIALRYFGEKLFGLKGCKSTEIPYKTGGNVLGFEGMAFGVSDNNESYVSFYNYYAEGNYWEDRNLPWYTLQSTWNKRFPKQVKKKFSRKEWKYLTSINNFPLNENQKLERIELLFKYNKKRKGKCYLAGAALFFEKPNDKSAKALKLILAEYRKEKVNDNSDVLSIWMDELGYYVHETHRKDLSSTMHNLTTFDKVEEGIVRYAFTTKNDLNDFKIWAGSTFPKTIMAGIHYPRCVALDTSIASYHSTGFLGSTIYYADFSLSKIGKYSTTKYIPSCILTTANLTDSSDLLAQPPPAGITVQVAIGNQKHSDGVSYLPDYEEVCTVKMKPEPKKYVAKETPKPSKDDNLSGPQKFIRDSRISLASFEVGVFKPYIDDGYVCVARKVLQTNAQGKVLITKSKLYDTAKYIIVVSNNASQYNSYHRIDLWDPKGKKHYNKYYSDFQAKAGTQNLHTVNFSPSKVIWPEIYIGTQANLPMIVYIFMKEI